MQEQRRLNAENNPLAVSEDVSRLRYVGIGWDSDPKELGGVKSLNEVSDSDTDAGNSDSGTDVTGADELRIAAGASLEWDEGYEGKLKDARKAAIIRKNRSLLPPLWQFWLEERNKCGFSGDCRLKRKQKEEARAKEEEEREKGKKGEKEEGLRWLTHDDINGVDGSVVTVGNDKFDNVCSVTAAGSSGCGPSSAEPTRPHTTTTTISAT